MAPYRLAEILRTMISMSFMRYLKFGGSILEIMKLTVPSVRRHSMDDHIDCSRLAHDSWRWVGLSAYAAASRRLPVLIAMIQILLFWFGPPKIRTLPDMALSYSYGRH